MGQSLYNGYNNFMSADANTRAEMLGNLTGRVAVDVALGAGQKLVLGKVKSLAKVKIKKLNTKQKKIISNYKGKKLVNSNHGNSLMTTKPAQGYALKDVNTNKVLKYGETTLGDKRYTRKYLRENNAYIDFQVKGTKKEMHYWQHEKILEYKKIIKGLDHL